MLARRSLLAGAVAIALAAASVAAVAAADRPGNSFPTVNAHRSMMHGWATAPRCSVPRLPGQRVTVILADMAAGSMMGGGRMTSGATWRMVGRTTLHAMPFRVSAGTVSLVGLNTGSRTHELVILPLAAGATAGSRIVGVDGIVSESGSLGEASRTCGPGGGDGISARSAGWVTLNLAPGRYELLCNLPGHYAAGMYGELDVR